MTLWSWRGAACTAIPTGNPVLQWGHDPVVMESPIRALARAPAHVLQWGHDPVVMERSVTNVRITIPSYLQWGHDPVVMESATRLTRTTPLSAFNGAMTLWSWRAFSGGNMAVEWILPSMGP